MVGVGRCIWGPILNLKFEYEICYSKFGLYGKGKVGGLILKLGSWWLFCAYMDKVHRVWTRLG